MDDRICIGADGCPGGWICVVSAGDGPLRAVFTPSLGDVVAHPADATVAVDMPIGLPDAGHGMEPGIRGCDRAARGLLGHPRSSSVFPAPVRDLLAIFTSLKSDTLISAQANKQMIEVLKAQHYNDMIPAKLPEGTEVAHKTGWITGVHHDSGIVYLPDGRSFVLIILSKEAPDREAVLNAGANISRMLYEFELK